MKKILWIAPVFLLLGSCEEEHVNVPVQNNCNLLVSNHPNAAKYQKIIDKFIDAGAVGVSVTVKTPAGTWSSAAGKADLSGNVNLSPCHTLRIGSITKTFASVAIMKLQEEGKLNIHDLAAKYLPAEYVKNLKNADKATIKNLLQHTSGIPDYLGMNRILDIQNLSVKKESPEESLKSVFGKKAEFEVGKGWSYSNTNYLLLSLIIKDITKKTSYEAVTDLIIKPLALQNTYASTVYPASLSRGYFDTFSNGIMKDQTEIDHNAVGGQDMLDGGMISNPHDLAIFVEALKTGKLISAKSLAEMESPVGFEVDVPEDMSYIKDYGLGLFLLDLDGKKASGHGGNVQCFNGITYYFPEQKISVAILLNSYSKKLQKALYDKATLELLF